MAMQGGLLTSVIANQKEQELEDLAQDRAKVKDKKRRKYLRLLQKKNAAMGSIDELDWLPVAMFLGAKLISHTLFGFLLGALGSVISLSLGVRLVFQVFTAVFMFATAMNLLQVHPIFRFVALQPPKFMQKWIRNSSKSKAVFAPAVLGFLTIFIPCGVTQAMEVLAISTGQPLQGALIMFAFVLGTMPLFALIGVATAKLSEGWNKKFMRLAAYVLVAMAVYSVNGVFVVLDSPLTLQKMTRPLTYFFSDDRFASVQAGGSVVNGVQRVTINVESRGYNPNRLAVNVGQPVELTLVSNGVYSCASYFSFPEFGIQAQLKPTDSQTFTFTPTKKGRFTFSCSMGMYSGVVEVR